MTAVGAYEEDLPRLVAELPVSRRVLLAKGPTLPGEMQSDCRVCEALFGVWKDSPSARALFEFHKADGSVGEACYRRCVAIYRAAGWTGVDDPREQHGFEGDDG